MIVIKIMLILALIGVVAWALITYIPLPAPFPLVIVAVGIIGGCIFAYRKMGWTFFND